MLTMNKLLLSSVIMLALSGVAQATGTHAGGHEKAVPAAAASTCTPEHASMGHCTMAEGAEHDMSKMEGSDHHNGMEENNSVVGQPAAEGVEPTKTYTVHLVDEMRFNFSEKPVIEAGDVVKFIVINKGKIVHEFGIGGEAEQVAHREMMKQMPGMKHEDGSTISVEPGATKELVWQFAGTEKVQFACNVPGHFEAGMHQEADILPVTATK